MNTSAQKYSLYPLPSDDWETRFTKQVVRNIARYRDLRGMTTEELALACSAVYGEPGKVKANTLNGLFAGKRKNIGIAELLVFAKALDVAPLFLALPLTTGESVESLPGSAPVHAFTAFNEGFDDGRRAPMNETEMDAGPSDESVAMNLYHMHEFHVERIIGVNLEYIATQIANRSHGGHAKALRRYEIALRSSLQGLSDTRFRLRTRGIVPPPIPDALSFVDQEPVPSVTIPIKGLASTEAVERMQHDAANDPDEWNEQWTEIALESPFNLESPYNEELLNGFIRSPTQNPDETEPAPRSGRDTNASEKRASSGVRASAKSAKGGRATPRGKSEAKRVDPR